MGFFCIKNCNFCKKENRAIDHIHVATKYIELRLIVVEYICFGILCRLLFIIWKNTPTLIFGSIFCSVMPWQSAIKATAKSNRKLCKEDTGKKLQLHQWFLLLRKMTIFLIFSTKYTEYRRQTRAINFPNYKMMSIE